MARRGEPWTPEQRARHAETMAARRLAKWGTTDVVEARRAQHRVHSAKTSHVRRLMRAEELLGRDPLELRVARLEGMIGALLDRVRFLEEPDRRIADGGQRRRRR